MAEKQPLSLTPKEKAYRRSVAQILAYSMKADPAWGSEFESIILFGSLARDEGHVGSDVDIAFCVPRSIPFTRDEYLDQSASLRNAVDRYRDELNIPFPVKPALLDNDWFRNPEVALVYPTVIYSVLREGVRLVSSGGSHHELLYTNQPLIFHYGNIDRVFVRIGQGNQHGKKDQGQKYSQERIQRYFGYFTV